MLGSVDSRADKIHHQRVHAASLMTDCASRFLAALNADQRGKAIFPFDTDERVGWHFIPKERKGLPLREMTPYQKHLASALLAAGLSQTGYIKAVTIMSLEDVLKVMENDSGERRNPEKYYPTNRKRAGRSPAHIWERGPELRSGAFGVKLYRRFFLRRLQRARFVGQ
jgi:hypothetical protein